MNNLYKLLIKIKEKNIVEITRYLLLKLDRFLSLLFFKIIFIIGVYRNNSIDLSFFHYYLNNNEKKGLMNQKDSSDLFLADLFCKHYFDLLGSGWICNNITLDKENYIDYFSKFISKQKINDFKVISEILLNNNEYFFIDWQKDFRNNYTFKALKASSKIKIEEDKGFDIKVPWELSRCQHLPFLAKIFVLTKNTKYAREIENEILDFINFNQVGFGVNWVCPMDIAIRISNWVVAVSICKSVDTSIFSSDFQRFFSKSVFEHASYIYYHLENLGLRNNHYFSDIVGLMFACSCLKNNSWASKTFAFAAEQFLTCIDEQFYDDGANFESSIAYHRLSLELICYGIWVLLLNRDKLKIKSLLNTDKYKNVWQKFIKAMNFIEDVTKPNGNIYQLGDNDSGHFFRFIHVGNILSNKDYIEKYENIKSCNFNAVWDENELSSKELLSLIEAIKTGKSKEFVFEAIGKIINPEYIKNCYIYNNKSEISLFPNNIVTNHLQYYNKQIFCFSKKRNISDFKLKKYKNFGVYIFSCSDYFLGISACSNGQNGNGGHGHNDKLAFELYDNCDIVTDSGSYLYTPNTKIRKLFRSTKSHSTIYFGTEQNDMKKTFAMPQQSFCDVLSLSNNEIVLKCVYKQYEHIRRFKLSESDLVIEDFASHPFVVPNLSKIHISNGYGKLLKISINR